MKKSKFLINIRTMGDSRQFLPEHLDLYQQIWNPVAREARPEIFGDECNGGLRWSTTEIIPISKINPRIDTVDKIQGAVRAGLNPEAQNITSSIVNNGWDLRELTICVSRDTDPDSPFDYKIVEGCTRYLSLAGLQFENILCEVFDHVDTSVSTDYFSVFMNDYGHPRGRLDAPSLQLFVTSQVEAQGYDLTTITKKEIMEATESIFKGLKKKLSRKMKQDIIYDLLSSAGMKPYETLNKEGVNKRLEPINDESEDVVYLAMGSDPDNLRHLTRYLRNEPEENKNKKIVFVPYEASLSVEKAEKDFYDLADAGATMRQTLRDLSSCVDRIANQTSIFPQIPQLWDKFEKGKLMTIPDGVSMADFVEQADA